MAKLDAVFDSSTVEELKDFEPFPPGQYNAMVTGSETKPSKNGEMIVLEVTIQDGEHAGRKIWENLNIKHTSEKAVAFAFRTLGALCKAVGKVSIKDTEELHNKRFTAVVAIKPPEGEYSAKNVIKNYLPYGGATPAEKEPASANTAPWKKKA